MNDIKKICVIGGDMRQKYAADALRCAGYDVNIFGIENQTDKSKYYTDIEKAIFEADLVILPLPFSTDGIKLSCPISKLDIRLDKLCESFSEGQIVAGGKFTPSFLDKLKNKKCVPLDYFTSERMNILNAIPTVEGAIAVAVNETKITIFGSKCGVVGYGRIGKILAKTLKNLGADVTVFARNPVALTWAEAEGYTPQKLSLLDKNADSLDIIFNTVPSVVIDRITLEKTKKEVLIIDLASQPGGVDRECAKELSRKVVFALSLPGKVAPETAGKIIASSIESVLEGGSL